LLIISLKFKLMMGFGSLDFWGFNLYSLGF